MNNKSTLLNTFLCLLVFSPFICFSQTDKKIPGYYITTSGDTIKGCFPGYKEWGNNPANVTFIGTNDTKTILTANNCKYLSIEGYDSYVSYSGFRLLNPTELQTATTDSSDQIEAISCFLRIIFINYQFQLFELQDAKRTNYFYKYKNEPIQELKYKGYISETSAFVQGDIYKQQLSNVFSAEIADKKIQVNELKYDELSLANFLETIYNTPAAAITSKSADKKKIKYFISGGIAVNSFSVSGDNTLPVVLAKYNTSISPVFIAGAIIPTQRNFGRLSFSPQLNVSSYDHSGTYKTGGPSYYDQTFTFRSSFKASLISYAGYNIVQANTLSWRLAGGLGVSYINNNEAIKKDNRNNGIIIDKLPSLEMSFNLQTSILLANKLMLLVDYSLPTDAANYEYYLGDLTTLYVTAGWAF
ncbi:hypothetical protein [Ferruginibacter albus]|uniref:hypothetical protein n=1 Tax=Ferruginibacter albus TaxID=2875540 RepID=UPI001CC5BDAD|nr:hypothetical protein [Ferruginibacter albus]UAY50608.1 hypothetical protein K9M53_08365 [Ferruginibacter albus]